VDILKKDFKGNLFHFSTLLFKYLCFLKKASNKSKASCILTPCLLQFPKYYVYQKLILASIYVRDNFKLGKVKA